MILETKYPSVVVEINTTHLAYKIVHKLDSGKFKVRRHVIGRPIKTASKGNPSHDNYGNQIYKRFNDLDDLKQNALNYVDNFLDVDKFNQPLK